MEGLGAATPFAQLVADTLADSRFTLLDIGCSSGIDPVWRIFGARLQAFCFDPNVEEIERLRRAETLPGINYVAAFVGVPPDDQGHARLQARDFWARNPWDRLSVTRTLQLRANAVAAAGNSEKTRMNLWDQVALADPAAPVIIPSFLARHGVADVDFLKLDVDGPDFLILRSLAGWLTDAQVIGVGIEVNFFGSDDPDIHSFHNVDRLMRACGFDLFALTSRSYSNASLPAPYQLDIPAQTLWGRPYQGDAIYLRDVAAPEQATWAAQLSSAKLAKLAAVFSLSALPDCAAEILLKFRQRLASRFDVDAALDLLVQQCVPPSESTSYVNYMDEFAANSARFHPSPTTAAETLQPGATPRNDVAPQPPPRAATGVVRIELAELHAEPQWESAGASCVRHSDRVVITTPPAAWHYAATVPLPALQAPPDMTWHRLKLSVSSVTGTIMVSLFDPQTNALLDETPLRTGNQPADYYVELRNPAHRLILLRNGPSAQASSAAIHGIELLATRITPGHTAS